MFLAFSVSSHRSKKRQGGHFVPPPPPGQLGLNNKHFHDELEIYNFSLIKVICKKIIKTLTLYFLVEKSSNKYDLNLLIYFEQSNYLFCLPCNISSPV